ncbi:hypothetical protein [Asaia astilbis]|uniref:hypothetical protein n=1 Tax=Asaia astilbis TaxID=610244 RepID=UPI0006843DB7|nr:hypothetical protein [Asaia astilbis]
MTRATAHCVASLAAEGGIVAIDDVMMRLTGRIIIETMLSAPDAVDADAMARGWVSFCIRPDGAFWAICLERPNGCPIPEKRAVVPQRKPCVPKP